MNRVPYWTVPTTAHCHICKRNTQQVDEHRVQGIKETVTRTCYSCGQVTQRVSMTAERKETP